MISVENDNRLTMLVSEVTVGMFISDVSCGWRNTPFLFEGLLINSIGQIKILKRFAEHVTIDVARCSETVALDLRYQMKKLVSSMPDKKVLDAANNRSPAFNYKPQFNAFPDQSIGCQGKWWQDLRAWLQNWKKAPQYRAQEHRKERPDYVPAHIELVHYETPVFNPASASIAITACQATVSLLKDVADRIAKNRLTSLASLESAADLLAEQIIAHPSAMLWGSKAIAGNTQLYQRSLEVGILLAVLGRQLGFPREELANLSLTGFLLDFGKTKITAELLHKTAPLTDDDRKTLQNHVTLTMEMLDQVKSVPSSVLLAVAEHHERIDGNGYPRALRGNEISVYGKMAAIVDSYVAMTGSRPYARTLSSYESFQELFKGADTQWHAPLIEQFVQAVGIFPAGTLVELSNGCLAIVLHDFRLRRLEPTVLVVTDSAKRRLSSPMQEDMWRRNLMDADSPVYIVKGLSDGSHGIELKDYYFGLQ